MHFVPKLILNSKRAFVYCSCCYSHLLVFKLITNAGNFFLGRYFWIFQPSYFEFEGLSHTEHLQSRPGGKKKKKHWLWRMTFLNSCNASWLLLFSSWARLLKMGRTYPLPGKSRSRFENFLWVWNCLPCAIASCNKLLIYLERTLRS